MKGPLFLGVPWPGATLYQMGECRIIVAREPFLPGGGLGWHLSISCEHRDPTWQEIHDARYALIPDEITMAMYLPPRAEYVNIHEHCFHLYEAEADKSSLIEPVRTVIAR